MAKEDQTPEYVADIKRYQYAKLAKHYAQSEDTQRYIPSALEQLALDMKEVSDTESQLIARVVEKGHGIEDVLDIYPKKYDEERNRLTVGQFVNNYDKLIAGLGEEKAGKLRNSLGKMGSSTLKDIAKKLDEVSYRLLGHQKGYQPLSEEELIKIQKTFEKYKLLNDIIGQIEDLYFDELGAPIIKKAKQKNLSNLVDKLNS